MREQKAASPLVGESKELEQNHCTVLSTHSTAHDIEKRVSIQIRMRKSVHGIVAGYCGKDMTFGQFYERAAIFYMDLNPSDRHILVVEKPENNHQNDDDWMLDLICIDDLEEFIELMETLIRDGTPIHKVRMKQFLVILKECKKVKNRSDKLSLLMTKARRYFE